MNAYIRLTQTNAQINDIPPRLMWNVVDNQWQSSASGYCGETSIITSGLLYGQYFPQYLVRQLLGDYFIQLWGPDPSNASTSLQAMWNLYFGLNWSDNGAPQGDYPQSGNVPLTWFAARVQYYCQVMPQIWSTSAPATNASFTPISAVLTQLHLAYQHFENQKQDTVNNFIPWLKQHVVQGHPVVMGVQDFLAGSNDPDFDHIVVVIGWGSMNDLTNYQYFPGDEIVLIDHGLVVGGRQPHGGSIPYYFRFTMATQNSVSATGGWLPDGGCPDPSNPAWNFIMDLGELRKLNAEGIPSDKGQFWCNTYQLAQSPSQWQNGSSGNAAFAITGLSDVLPAGVQVRIDCNAYYEVPVITTAQATSGAAPTSSQTVQHTITVSGLDAAKSYKLWLFTATTTDEIRALPTSGFNAYGAMSGAQFLPISGVSSFVYTQRLGAQTALMARCVEANS